MFQSFDQHSELALQRATYEISHSFHRPMEG